MEPGAGVQPRERRQQHAKAPMSPRQVLLATVLLSVFTWTSVGGLPANCATPTKKVKAMAKRFFDPTKAGEVFCPLRKKPIEHLEASFAHIAGQESARVRPCHSLWESRNAA